MDLQIDVAGGAVDGDEGVALVTLEGRQMLQVDMDEADAGFFEDANRQQRMDESELHHDRSPLAGVVRELESQPEINQFLAGTHTRRNARFRQAVGVLVRMIMERRGWRAARSPYGPRSGTSRPG